MHASVAEIGRSRVLECYFGSSISLPACFGRTCQCKLDVDSGPSADFGQQLSGLFVKACHDPICSDKLEFPIMQLDAQCEAAAT